MRGRLVLLSASVILLAVCAGALSLLRRDAAEKKNQAAKQAQAAPIPKEITLAGKLEAQHVIPVGAQVNGEIESFGAEPGQDVYEGQLLARISNRALEGARVNAYEAERNAQLKVESIQSKIIAARLEASRARAEASRSRDQFDRAQRIYQRQQVLHGAGATPQLTYEKAQREFESADGEYRSLDELARQAEDRVNGLTQELQAAKKTLDDKSKELEDVAGNLAAGEVHSPVTGIVIARNGEVGKQISPEEGKDLFQIAVDPGQLRLVLDPEPPVLKRIHAGQAALVIAADLTTEGMPGAVKEIQGNQAIVEFISSNSALRPGMTAQARINLE